MQQSQMPGDGTCVPSSAALRGAMQSLANAYADPQLQAMLKACREESSGMQIIARMRELLLPVQQPVLELLGLPADATGLAAMQNAVNRRVCEGDAELKRLANEALRLLDLAPMKQLAQEVTAEEWFERMHGEHFQLDGIDVEQVLEGADGETAQLVAALRRRRQPRCRLSLGLLTVWSHWEKHGLPDSCATWMGSSPSASSKASLTYLDKPTAAEVWEFVRRNEPLVITGLVDATGFPPLRDFADFSYLRKRCGQRPVKLKGDLAADRDGRSLFMADPTVEMPFAEYLDLVEEAERLSKPPAFYMGKMPLHRELPELFEDINSAPGSPWAKLSSCFGANSAGVHTYFGCGRNSTAIHFDPSENLLVVVAGTKTFELYPPADVDCLYATKPPGYVHSAVPPFLPSKDLPPDLEARFPMYSQAQAVRVDLKAGDVLYLPIFWWHAVSGSMERNMIVNWWCNMHEEKKTPNPTESEAALALRAVRQSLTSAGAAVKAQMA
mmetsp:Transcript_19613/g.45653  ORF Transcript_19613/g.45653 Transcript_19613/m.45653 type:complete len:498 (-) Transcript_19613:57-1550(-)